MPEPQTPTFQPSYDDTDVAPALAAQLAATILAHERTKSALDRATTHIAGLAQRIRELEAPALDTVPENAEDPRRTEQLS